MRRRPVDDTPLLLLLLPARLEAFALRAQAEALLAAPGAVAIEPARVSYRSLGGLPAPVASSVARRQAKRMRLPGVPQAVAVFDPLQLPLAGALIERHPDAEVWDLAGAYREADFVLDLTRDRDLRPAWERMESLGVASGRLGSERAG